MELTTKSPSATLTFDMERTHVDHAKCTILS